MSIRITKNGVIFYDFKGVILFDVSEVAGLQNTS